MKLVWRALPAGVLALSLLQGGCTSALRGRISGLRDVALEAERNGARVCAPRELAMAITHLEFADAELTQGQPGRAEEHIRIAEPNAHAALHLSPAARCIVSEEAAPPPPQPGDRDGDGILDNVDQCPDDPEDIDANADEDGCPETEDTDGDGIEDATDLCPLEPEDRDDYLDTDGCRESDNDLDAVPDDVDQCDNEPEDRDGTNDSDGCPDPDNDHDNVLDVRDRCPNEPGVEAESGCPRVYENVEVTSTGIVIRQQIFFAFNRAVIQSQSFTILDTVAQVMRDFPDVSIEVQGHTDSRGNDAFNLRLSQQRADAVRQYLIQQGISEARLTSRGYGETQPIETNATNEGRGLNRRVEFVRTDARAGQR